MIPSSKQLAFADRTIRDFGPEVCCGDASPEERTSGGEEGSRKGRECAEVNASERDFCAVRDRCVNLTVEYEPASVLICYGNEGKETSVRLG